MGSTVVLSDDDVFGPQNQQPLSDADVFGAPATAQAMPPQSQAAQPNWRQQAMGSSIGQFMRGAMEPIYGGGQLLYKGIGALTSLGGYAPNSVSNTFNEAGDKVGQEEDQSEKSYELARSMMGQSGFNPSKVAGAIASPVNALGGALDFASPLATTLARGAFYGSTSPGSTTPNYWTDKATNAGIGALTGGVLHGGGQLASALVDPASSYGPNVNTLIKAGVPLTTGQIVGGPLRTMEDSLTSIPFIGDTIKARQRDAMAGLNTAVINRSLAPIGETLPPGMVGHDAITYAQGKLGDAYNNLVPKLSATADPQLQQDLNGIVTNATRDYGLNQSGQQNLFDMLHGQIVQKAGPGGAYSGDALKDIQSNLSYQARNFAKSQNPDQKNMADALFDARQAFNDFIARQNTNEAPQLNAINTGYANYARAEGASAASKTGIFTPSELNRAVKQGGTRAQNASGNALMQDLSSAGIGVLPQTVPDSGTAMRRLMEFGMGALAGGEAEHLAPGFGTGAALLGGGLTVGGTRPVQALARSLLTSRPYGDQTAANLSGAIQNSIPTISRTAIPALATSLMNPTPQ